MTKQLSYCGELVREHDPDRFLCSMFAPVECREALWAVFAFNHEIAKTREVVSETQLGLIRLQWWREAISKIYEGEVVEHEVVKALADAIKAHDLLQEHFDMLLHAREFDLEDVQPGNIEGLVNYADFTTTPLMKLAVQITGDDPEMEPVQPVAVNYALIGILRAAPFHKAQGRCYMPEDVFKADNWPEVAKVVSEQIILDVKPQNRFLKASQVLVKIYAKQLKSCRFDVFEPKLQIPPVFKVLRLILGVKFIH